MGKKGAGDIICFSSLPLPGASWRSWPSQPQQCLHTPPPPAACSVPLHWLRGSLSPFSFVGGREKEGVLGRLNTFVFHSSPPGRPWLYQQPCALVCDLHFLFI